MSSEGSVGRRSSSCPRPRRELLQPTLLLSELLPSVVAGDPGNHVSFPGVQATAAGAFSPLLSVSIGGSVDTLHSPLDSASYASADAARVGGGLYKHLLQAACTLATDPAPKVARIGKAALRVADVELAPVLSAAGQPPPLPPLPHAPPVRACIAASSLSPHLPLNGGAIGCISVIVSLFGYPLIRLLASVRLSVHTHVSSIHPSVCPSVRPTIHPCTHLSIHSPTHPFIPV